MTGGWTLDELVARVQDTLGAAGYAGAPNGRVRELPDRRAVRWYTTIGLLDRPAGMRGRTALYGERHLAQLVAIKRRQAQGHTLAAIQAELVGAGDRALRAIAGLPDAAPAGPDSLARPDAAPAGPDRFARPDAAPDPAGQPGAGPSASTFWTRPAAPPGPPVPVPVPELVPEPAPVPQPQPGLEPWPEPEPERAAEPGPAPAAASGGALLTGVPLGGGAVLLVPVRPDTADLAALHAAARPLIDLLIARGLVAGPARRSST